VSQEGRQQERGVGWELARARTQTVATEQSSAKRHVHAHAAHTQTGVQPLEDTEHRRTDIQTHLKASVTKKGDPGGFPLEDDINDESKEDPIETALEHISRVEHAHAKVQAASHEEEEAAEEEEKEEMSVYTIIRA
jgi:hypothetical protein